MTRILASAVAAVLAGCATVGRPPEPSYTTLIAHRGESYDAPENTLPAYRTAVERGFGFECDIYLSKDGKLYTFHDERLTRTTGGANSNDCTAVDWETVSKLNVGGWGRWKGSKYDPTRPALFSEVLALARDGRYIYVEVKRDNPSWVAYIKEEIGKAKNVNPSNVLFISFRDKVCTELKRQMPDYKVYWLTYGKWSDPAQLIEALGKMKVDGVDISYKPDIYDAAYVKAIHDAGFSFHVWTVDWPERCEKAFAAGVDTLTTNCAKYLLDEHLKNKAKQHTLKGGLK